MQMQFNIQTMMVKNGRALRAITPDKDGIYKKVPMGIIGKTSRNDSLYSGSSTLRCISEGTRFHMNLTEGNLEGEWGHPFCFGKEDIPRLLVIDRTKVSHYILRIYSEPTSDGLYTIIYGDIKPCGPFGKYLVESFADPTRNTAFSMRTVSKIVHQKDGVDHKEMIILVTFDAVDGPGYEEASKRYIPSNEGFELHTFDSESIDFEEVMGMQEYMAASNESIITHQELIDRMMEDSVKVRNVSGILCPEKKAIITPQGAKSVFHTMFK